MHAEQPGDALIDRELAAALAVEPSAEFLARVRMRIALEPEPSAWRRSWTFAAVGACATAMAVGLAVQMQQALPPDPDRLPRPSTVFSNLSDAAPDIAPAPLALAVAAARRDESSGPSRNAPTPAMRAIMQSNADAGAGLEAHVEQKDYDAIARDAATYKQNFAYIEAFWANKQVDGALAVSRTGLIAAADLETAALARDETAVLKAMAVLAGTCGVCHKQHREQLPDKTYEIRL